MSDVAQIPRPRSVTVAIYLGIILVLAAFLIPMFYLVNGALKTQGDFMADPTGLTTTFEWHNFIDAWNQANFGRYLLNSLLYTLGSAFIGTLASLLVAFPVSRGYLKWSGLWNGVFVIGLFLPIALITQFQIILRLGLYDTPLGYMLLMSAAVGISPILIASYMRAVPMELDEAAAMDGVGYFRFLFTFIVPLSKPVLVTAFILHALFVWNEIILASVVFSDPDKFPASIGLLSFQGQYSTQWPLLAAATLIVAAPIVIMYFALQRYLVAGALGGAFKG